MVCGPTDLRLALVEVIRKIKNEKFAHINTMSQISTPKLHHYVPRFLLRRFGSGKKDKVNVFDKSNGAKFTSVVKNVAAENYLYDFEFNGHPLTIEPSLSELEGRAAYHIRHILEERCLDVSDAVQRGELARFIAVQMIRTRAHLEMMGHMSTTMEIWLRENGAPDDFFKPDPLIGSGENAQRASMARMICNAPNDFGPSLINKDWILFEADRKHPFIIGDHPVAMHNIIDRSPRGNLGLNVEGIEIYLPLSPELILGMWCPSHQTRMIVEIEKMSDAYDAAQFIPATVASSWRRLLDTVEAIRTGKPLKIQAENVEHYNALQVLYAERFIFSTNGDFSLAEDMIRMSPELRHGRRIEEATGKF